MASTIDNYDAQSITVLEGLAGVRKRPGMYIGDVGESGIHHLVWEILDNAVDEALAGYCTKIDITLEKSGAVTITDDGRGVPTDIHPVKKVPAVDVVFTMLHAGGKFDSKSYGFSGGLHGVGASVVNALSDWVKVTISHGDGLVWRREYIKGVPQGDLKPRKNSAAKRGTAVEFLPDLSIFTEHKGFNCLKILRRIKEISYLLPSLKFTLTDDRGDEKQKWVICSPKGPAGLVKDIAEGKETDIAELKIDGDGNGFVTSQRNIFSTHYEDKDFRADISFAYVKAYKETVLSFVNLIPTDEGGTHVTGFRGALTKCVNNAAKKKNILKGKTTNLTGSELQEGLLAVISDFVKDPQFEGQTKKKLGNGDVEAKVSTAVYDALSKYFDENPKEIKAITDKALSARKAREKAKAAVELVRHGAKNSLHERMELPSKLAACTSKDRSKCELFLVEGDSAGGSAKQARNREYQAIMPLRGKILNCHKAELHRIVANAEIKSMIQILGCGTKNTYDESKLRYDKIIFLTDADVDGSHISCLLITFFYNIIPQLLKNGHIYVAQPPLYLFQKERSGPEYLFSDEELRKKTEAYRKECARRGKTPNYKVQRYKGLGEMNPEQLWATTMDPEHRTLRKVTIHDWERVSKSIDLLMGDEVEPRRNWIMEHGAEASAGLDV